MPDDPKQDVQESLPALAELCPVGVYTHRNGGTYVVFAHSVNEATLAPLVHYYSVDKRTRWTRTIKNFVEKVGGVPRFSFVAYVSLAQFNAAINVSEPR